jgi:hypothetical protein
MVLNELMEGYKKKSQESFTSSFIKQHSKTASHRTTGSISTFENCKVIQQQQSFIGFLQLLKTAKSFNNNNPSLDFYNF